MRPVLYERFVGENGDSMQRLRELPFQAGVLRLGVLIRFAIFFTDRCNLRHAINSYCQANDWSPTTP